MAITKTIGGDRLGSGKKMKQSYNEYERSNHDLSYIWRSTIAPGTLVPFLSKVMLPGDTFDIKLDTQTMTYPTVGPLLGSFKLQLDVFSIPIRLYQAQLHNNKLGIGMNMEKIKLPQLSIDTSDLDFNSAIPIDMQQINPSSLLAYLGIRGLGQSADTGKAFNVKKNALPYLMYWDIYKNYYANKQEEIGVMVDYTESPVSSITTTTLKNPGGTTQILPHKLAEQGAYHLVLTGRNLDPKYISVNIKRSDTGNVENLPFNQYIFTYTETLNPTTGERIGIDAIVQGYQWAQTTLVGVQIDADTIDVPEPKLTKFPLKNIDDMREDILAAIKQTTPFSIDSKTYAPYGNSIANVTITGLSKIRSYLTMQGLACKTYQSDLFNNWMSTEWIDGPNGVAAVSAIDVSGGTLKMDAINLAQKVYNMLNRVAISGGSYYDWIEAIYSQKAHGQAETPIYLGGLSKEIIFQEVISNSATEDQPLGSLGGRGTQSGKHKGGKIIVRANEHSYVIGIVSLTPRIDYSQGNEWDTRLETMNDFHKPELDEIGFQNLITDQIAAWDTKVNVGGILTTKSAGKVPAWINYMTDVNKCYGHFADSRSEMFMTLNRRYTVDKTTKSIQDLTTYIDPAKFNYTFADTRRDAQNFWLQISVGIEARRKVSARQIPNL